MQRWRGSMFYFFILCHTKTAILIFFKKWCCTAGRFFSFLFTAIIWIWYLVKAWELQKSVLVSKFLTKLMLQLKSLVKSATFFLIHLWLVFPPPPLLRLLRGFSVKDNPLKAFPDPGVLQEKNFGTKGRATLFILRVRQHDHFPFSRVVVWFYSYAQQDQ